MHKPMLRMLPDGSNLTWSVATMSRFDDPSRAPKPFFISWDDPSKRPDKVRHSAAAQHCQLEVCLIIGKEQCSHGVS